MLSVAWLFLLKIKSSNSISGGEMFLKLLPLLLPALWPVLSPLVMPIFNWSMKKYRQMSTSLELALLPLSNFRSLFFGAAGIVSLCWMWVFSLTYNKFSAKWFTGTRIEVSVFNAAIVVSIIAVLSLTSTKWFRKRKKPTEWATMLVLGAILFLSTFLGVFFTENSQSRGANTSSYNYWETRTGYWLHTQWYGNPDYESTDVDSNSEDNGDWYIALGYIAILVLSAVVPHFWFLGGIVIVNWMGVVFLRELLKQLQHKEFRLGVLKN